MNKNNTEFKEWCQLYLSTQKTVAGVIPGRVLSGSRSCRCTVVRCGQFFGAALLAYGIYLLNLMAADGVRLLAALAATSALVHIALAIQSRTGALALLNLFAVPILFATAYAGQNVATVWLIVSFILHGSVTAVQLSSVDKNLSGSLFCWSVFNSAMALFLLPG